MKEQLENFRLAKYRFVLKPREFIKLSSFAGSSLRKNFRSVFKQITCLETHEECEPCKMKEDCPYYVTIEEGYATSNPKYKRFQTPPKPFIFEPPLKRKTFYSRNDELYFDLILIGRALEYFPYFAASLRRIGELGIGKNRGEYSLNKIYAFDLLKNTIAGEYTFHSDNPHYDRDISVSLSQLYEKYEEEHENIKEAVLSLITPLRMKRLGSENWHLNFRTLTKNILTRIGNLGFAYCGYEDFLQFSEIIYKAGTVRTAKENFIWEDWRPPAMRKKNNDSKLGGYLGDITYQGNIEEFWPIIKLAETLHIGKNTSFGLGRVLIEPNQIEQNQE